MTWEVSIAKGLSARVPVVRGVAASDPALAEAVVHALKQGHAVVVVREDWTPEARSKKWENDFYDIDKAGRKRRRYRKTAIEREWEEFFTSRKREARASRATTKAGNVQCPDCPRTWSRKAPSDYVCACKRDL